MFSRRIATLNCAGGRRVSADSRRRWFSSLLWSVVLWWVVPSPFSAPGAPRVRLFTRPLSSATLSLAPRPATSSQQTALSLWQHRPLLSSFSLSSPSPRGSFRASRSVPLFPEWHSLSEQRPETREPRKREIRRDLSPSDKTLVTRVHVRVRVIRYICCTLYVVLNLSLVSLSKPETLAWPSCHHCRARSPLS